LARRLEQQRLPRILDIKDLVDRGELLSDYDLRFLQSVLRDAERVIAMKVQQTEFQHLVDHVVTLYHAITEQALANEQGGKDGQ
jgi:hypothetical protein